MISILQRELSSNDLISELPSDVIDYILSFLPLKDVIRTSSLSTKWKTIWVALPRLILDKHTLEGAFLPSDDPATMDKVAKCIDEVLLQRVEPIIRFKLSIRKMKSCPSIDIWINLLSRHCVKALTLKLWTGQPHQFSSRFCSLEYLSYLKLRNCFVKLPPRFDGFKMLTYMHFHEVTIAEGSLNLLISTSPRLQQVSLIYLTGPDTLSINAENLQTLRVACNLSSVHFKNTPCLESIDLFLLQLTKSASIASDSDSFQIDRC